MKFSHAYSAIAAASGFFPGLFDGVHASQDTKTALPTTQHGQPLAYTKDFVRSGTVDTGRNLALSTIFPTIDQTLSDGTSTNGVTIADVNDDGNNDLLVANNQGENQLYLGDGTGAFPTTPIVLPGSGVGYTISIVAGDFNNDGHTDIFVSNYLTGEDQVLLLNDQSGNFPTVTAVGVPSYLYSYGPVMADFNKDGNLDLFIPTYRPDGSALLLGNGDGTFVASQLPDAGSAGSGKRCGAVGDFNNDGNVDIVVIQAGSLGGNNPKVLINDGSSGTPTWTVVDVPGPASFLKVCVGDFNKDGYDDFIATTPDALPNQLYMNDGNPTVSFTKSDLPGNIAGTTTKSYGCAVGDLNGDGYDDITIVNYDGQVSQMLLNIQGGGFAVSELPIGASTGSNTGSVAMGDVNNDGRLDLFVGSWIDDAVGPSYNYLLISDSTHTVSTGTAGPTTSPTKNPTSSPSSSPTITTGPWEVEFLDMIANFTMTSADEITATYHVGRGRTYNAVLYQKGCKDKSPITDITITSASSTQQFNSTLDTLTVSHSIDKSQIASSTQIWNSTANKLEVCQVVELKEGNMVVITNEYELAIDFNLVVDYDTGNVTLQQAQTESDVVNTNVDDYISAFKCDGGGFGASNTAHLENTQLNVCIESESTEVEIDKIQNMTITQVVDGAADKTWNIIEDDEAKFTTLTSKTYVPGKGVFVTTFLPSSTFSYTGNPITVSGKVELRLANGRKLTVNIDSVIDDAGKDRSLQVDDEQSASFGVDVALEPQAVDEDEAIMNSATSTTGMQVFASLVFALVYSMM